MPPKYGTWRNPNLPKKGIYKLLGGKKDEPYIEQMDQDPVRFHPRTEKGPIWRSVTPGLQLSVVSIMNNDRNIKRERLIWET